MAHSVFIHRRGLPELIATQNTKSGCRNSEKCGWYWVLLSFFFLPTVKKKKTKPKIESGTSREHIYNMRHSSVSLVWIFAHIHCLTRVWSISFLNAWENISHDFWRVWGKGRQKKQHVILVELAVSRVLITPPPMSATYAQRHQRVTKNHKRMKKISFYNFIQYISDICGWNTNWHVSEAPTNQ